MNIFESLILSENKFINYVAPNDKLTFNSKEEQRSEVLEFQKIKSCRTCFFVPEICSIVIKPHGSYHHW